MNQVVYNSCTLCGGNGHALSGCPWRGFTGLMQPLAVTVCRECNQRFGAGRHHFATCAQHKNESWHAANDRAALSLQISTQDKLGSI